MTQPMSVVSDSQIRSERGKWSVSSHHRASLGLHVRTRAITCVLYLHHNSRVKRVPVLSLTDPGRKHLAGRATQRPS